MSRVQASFYLLLFAFLPSMVFHYTIVHAIRHHNQDSKHSFFSSTLHPRNSISNTQRRHKINYTSLAISDLASDNARVNRINARLQKALFGDYSHPNNFTEEEIDTSISSSGGGYFARIGVGQPATDFDLLADTGSEITWIKCSPGSGFDPSQSSTYQPLSCSSQQCDALLQEKVCNSDSGSGSVCGYSVSYGDNSFTRGDYVTETLTFGSSGYITNVGIGCGLENGGTNFAGLLGLGPSPASFPSQIEATSFSYCLVEPGSSSSSTLDFNSAAPGDSVNVKLVQNPMKNLYYYVELSGINVGDEQIPVPPSVYQIGSDGTGGVIVDSGTTLNLLDSDVYSSFRDAFRRNAQNLGSPGSFMGYETCYEVPSGTSVSDIQGPAMSIQFSDGQIIALGPGNYFKQVADSIFCLAFKPTNQIVSILGNILQSGMRVTYDLGNNLIGFSPNKC